MVDVEISPSGQNLYMKYKLCMSRYSGILGGGHLLWALLVLGGGGVRDENRWAECNHILEGEKRLVLFWGPWGGI